MINFPWIVHVLLMDDSNTLSYIAYVIVVNRLHLHWSPSSSSSSPPPIEGEKFIHWSSHHHFVIYRLVIIVSYCSSSLLLSFESVCVYVFFSSFMWNFIYFFSDFLFIRCDLVFFGPANIEPNWQSNKRNQTHRKTIYTSSHYTIATGKKKPHQSNLVHCACGYC